jgi:gamma-polyglutamate biosynthesis protein CapA
MKRTMLLILFILAVILLGYSSAGDARWLKSEAKILFVGDIFFDRYIRQVTDKQGGDYVFKCVDSLLNDADVVVGNLEGPITDNASKSAGTEPGSPLNFVFTFPPGSADLLYKHNIKIVNLGNNHISNFGREGIAQTEKYLTDAGVDYFGGLSGKENVYKTRLHGNDLSFISYNQFGGDSADKVALKIKEMKSENPNSNIIIYAHWGEEYVEPTLQMRNIAKKFAGSGATAIIGSHPHVVQTSEKIGDTIVYYSLGNFIFDQYWNEEVSTGLAVELTITDTGIKIVEHPLSLKRTGQTCLK